ncbi:hypothetical protein QBC43DRAFT_327417 [Cladorrhinum sp. PSN259]|nr:hypothetical protein QBC43DRAFT_327417 [Cladorrhinum sp. PSN259]
MLRQALHKGNQRAPAAVLSAAQLASSTQQRSHFHTSRVLASLATDENKPHKTSSSASGSSTATNTNLKRQQKKTLKEMDEELRQKMEGISGDGGASGVEYEDGKPADMKRSVRDNMFRYI